MKNAISNYIETHGTNAYQVAKRCGLNPATVGRHIKGETDISLDSARKYNRHLGIPLDALLAVDNPVEAA